MMKILALVAFVAFVQGQDISLRAPSTFQNCDCQCDSYTWTNKNGQLVGNCKTADASGFFCYVSGRAVQACRDVKPSSSRTDSFANTPKFFSYEACSTPPRNQCYNKPPVFQNLGDGDHRSG